MIARTDDGISEQESMVVSDGFVLCNSHLNLSFRNSPFEGDPSFPLFYVFNVNKGHPLVVYNNGGSVSVYPKKDFDALHSKTDKIRSPTEWSGDRVAYDLATFTLIPYDIDEEDTRGWKKIDYLEGQGRFSGASLLFVEHGLLMGDSQRAAHVMPSVVPQFFYEWLLRDHAISSYDGKKNVWNFERTIKVPLGGARGLANDVNGLLEARFETKLDLKR